MDICSRSTLLSLLAISPHLQLSIVSLHFLTLTSEMSLYFILHFLTQCSVDIYILSNPSQISTNDASNSDVTETRFWRHFVHGILRKKLSKYKTSLKRSGGFMSFIKERLSCGIISESPPERPASCQYNGSQNPIQNLADTLQLHKGCARYWQGRICELLTGTVAVALWV